MDDFQVLVWIIFVIIAGLVGFLAGIIWAHDKSDQNLVKEFMNEQKQANKEIEKEWKAINIRDLSNRRKQGASSALIPSGIAEKQDM